MKPETELSPYARWTKPWVSRPFWRRLPPIVDLSGRLPRQHDAIAAARKRLKDRDRQGKDRR